MSRVRRAGHFFSFQVRESGELFNFQCRELGELVVNSVAGEAGQQFTVSRVMRAGCHSVRLMRFDMLAVLRSRRSDSFAVGEFLQFCSSRVRRAGSFVVRELGELVVYSVAS